MFDPSASSTYANESCTSTYCTSTTTGTTTCSDGTCAYYEEYADGSTTEGYQAKETLTLTASDVITGFLFGCGHKNQGLFRGAAGLLGLGRGKISIVEQAAGKHHRLFSYCLPTTLSSTGHLTFGGSASAEASYTPMLSLPAAASSLYALKLLSITIAGVQLAIADSSVTVLDIGSTITILPPATYSALRSEFKKQMAQYPPAAYSVAGLDTCYDLSGAGDAVTFPKISLAFGGGAVVDLQPANIMMGTSRSSMYLAFNGEGGVVTQLGNIQQRGFEVVHDIAGARIGFIAGAC